MTPELTKVAVTRSDGTVAILGFVTRGHGSVLPAGARWVSQTDGIWEREANDGNIFSLIVAMYAAGPQPTGYRVVRESDLPGDRSYREAWRDTGTVIDHDMVRAREIHLARVRVARVERLSELDNEWMRATGQGDRPAADAVEAERQRLRDLPTTLGVEACNTVEELKALGLGV